MGIEPAHLGAQGHVVIAGMLRADMGDEALFSDKAFGPDFFTAWDSTRKRGLIVRRLHVLVVVGRLCKWLRCLLVLTGKAPKRLVAILRTVRVGADRELSMHATS